MRRYLCLALMLTLTVATNANAGKCGGGKMKFFGGKKNKGAACASYAVATVQSCGSVTTYQSAATYNYPAPPVGVYASPQVPSKAVPVTAASTPVATAKPGGTPPPTFFPDDAAVPRGALPPQ